MGMHKLPEKKRNREKKSIHLKNRSPENVAKRNMLQRIFVVVVVFRPLEKVSTNFLCVRWVIFCLVPFIISLAQFVGFYIASEFIGYRKVSGSHFFFSFSSSNKLVVCAKQIPFLPHFTWYFGNKTKF